MDGDTALHYAVHVGNIAMAEKLLLLEANIEAKNTVEFNISTYKLFEIHVFPSYKHLILKLRTA